MSHKQAEQKYHDAHARCHDFEVGEMVLELNHCDGSNFEIVYR